ncbi:MAG: glycosyltransferase [Chloroflexota bacterium]
MRIHQLTFGLIPGDAVSNSTLAMDAQLRMWGFETAVYAQHIAPELKTRALPDAQFIPLLDSSDDLLIFHYSIYSPNVRLFQAFSGRKVLVYHNITPAKFFTGWDNHQAALCNMGRNVLKTITHCDLAVGDSDFNCQELIEAGFDPAKTAVLPLFLTLPEPMGNGRAASKIATWLTVGRVAPSKAIEDVLRIFAIYKHNINPNAQLFIVGSLSLTSYVAALKLLIDDLSLTSSAHLMGLVSNSELEAHYRQADLYLTASQHEGFCVPLLESMVYGVPILARHSSAIPETLGEAGILFHELGYEAVAEMAHILISDPVIRQQVIETQYQRVAHFNPKQAAASLRAVLHRLGIPVGE